MGVAKVEIYTTRLCPYCFRAKALLNRKGVTYREIDVSNAPEMRRWLSDQTGQRTVPQVFVNGRHIGGLEDLQSWTRRAA